MIYSLRSRIYCGFQNLSYWAMWFCISTRCVFITWNWWFMPAKKTDFLKIIFRNHKYILAACYGWKIMFCLSETFHMALFLKCIIWGALILNSSKEHIYKCLNYVFYNMIYSGYFTLAPPSFDYLKLLNN